MSRSVLRLMRLATALLTLIASSSAMMVGASAAVASPGGATASAASSGNAAPPVVPTLRDWSGGNGKLTLGSGSRIIVDSADASTLTGTAKTLRDDLADRIGLSMPVVPAAQPSDGDIFLSLHGADSSLGHEGYGLKIAGDIEIRGNSDAGVFYGTQTVLQMLTSTPGHRTLPHGAAQDWPNQKERGFLLDAGRKYWSPDSVIREIREMAYLRLNTLQLHLTDNNAFRLVSDRYPNLAAPQAYTKADIARMEAAAAKYHVNIIPEIEMPAHAAAIVKAHPEVGWDCPAMGTGTLDVTKPATLELTSALIDEFAPLFHGPEFHIATDEYPTQATQEQCPELVNYAKAHGFANTSDVFVDFINKMNTVVRSHGKRMVIWNWWDVDQTPDIQPDKNIKVEAWTTAAESDQDHSVKKYLEMGYDVVASPSDSLYVTPGFPLLPDTESLYEKWTPIQDPHLDGYQISVWADDAFTRPDTYFDTFLRRPREVLADRLWGGPRVGTVADFFARADAIGTPPGVPTYTLPGKLTGTSYGTGPAWPDNPTSTFDKAFDGDATTNFLYSKPDGGYTGLDLGAGHESAVGTIRFFPGANQTELDRMKGGRFEGCTDGPTSGCHVLATLNSAPDFGWNEVHVSDSGRYRWLRYVSPDNGYASVAEIEFHAPQNPAVTVNGPDQLRQLGDNPVVTSYHNTGNQAVHDVKLSLEPYSTQGQGVLDVQAQGTREFSTVPPGQSVSTTWQVNVPLSAEAGGYHLLGRASYTDQAAAGQGDSQFISDAAAYSSSKLAPALVAHLDPGNVGLDAGDSVPSLLRVTNNAARPVTLGWHEVRLSTANPGFTIQPAQGSMSVPAGGTTSATLTVSASDTAKGPTPPLRVDLTAGTAGQPTIRAGSVDLRIHSRLHPYLSDLDWTEATSEWSTVTRDTYVGSDEPMTLNGVRYQKGLGAAGNSRISFNLGGKCSRLTATIGIDDAADFTTDGGTAHFFVYVDGRKVYESGLITRHVVKSVDVDISGADTLSLVTDNAGDGFDHDAVDWADALVHCS